MLGLRSASRLPTLAYWVRAPRPDLQEDWVTWTQDGMVRRYRLSDMVLDFLENPEVAEQI